MRICVTRERIGESRAYDDEKRQCLVRVPGLDYVLKREETWRWPKMLQESSEIPDHICLFEVKL